MPKPLNGELDDEAVHLRQRALYFEPLNLPPQKDVVPTNGHEYIHMVRKERAEIHPEASKEDYLIVTLDPGERPTSPPPKRKLREWKKYMASQFSQMALRLTSDRDRLAAKYPPKGRLPPVEDEEDCCIYCLGTDLYGKIYEDDHRRPVVAVDGHLPYLSVVLHLGQDEILRLLGYLRGWSCVVGMDHAIGKWTYALMAVLRKPVSEECEQFLEEFYDECLLRAEVCDESEKYQIHLVSAILGNYFCVKAYKLGTPVERFQNLSIY